MSGGGGSTSTVQKADPWYGQQPYLSDIFKNSQDIYGKNASSYYPGQTYLPWNQLQQSGIDTQLGAVPQMQQIANESGSGLNTLLNAGNLNTGLSNQYQNALRSSMGANIDSALNSLTRNQQNQGGLLSQQLQNNISSQQRAYDSSAGRTIDDLTALREMQARDYNVSRNALTEDLTRNILPSISSGAVSAGQAGSSRQGIAEGLALSNAQNRLAELGRTQDETLASQLRASGLSLGDLARSQSENIGQTATGNAFGLGQLSREQAAQAGDVSNTLGSQANLNMADFMKSQYGQGLDAVKGGLALAPTVQGMYGLPGQTLSGIGQQVYGQQMLPIQESINRYNYNQQAPWNDINMYSSIVNGIPAGLGTTTTSGDTSGSQFGSAAGGALTGMGIAQGLSSPFGAALFGGTPTLAGLGAAGTLGLYGLGGALLGGIL